MRITVIGATRGIGRKVMEEALSRGHHVRAVARSADKIDIEDENLEKLPGDATDAEDMAKAVADAEAVILAIGVPRNAKALMPTTLFSDAARAIIPAMEAAGIKRFLTVTGFGAGDSYAKLSWPEKVTFKAILGRAYADKAVQEDLIKASSLDWTIARPGILTDNKGTGRYQVLVEPETWRQGVIARADVAHYLVGAAENGTEIHKTPAIQR
ncbi:Flavin reductase [Roseibacterium elongatum DSM 19469]|uniref:Flavin reductase n=1 Tax=Roseicyclus elongatus DSM 19469 TaxID=1294273 RepID=W8RZH5_9RHOB|nr:SDR family oxidoreductase [Roseibacterium elongatum]AHM03282.1 Flavin reductase [Roseibacterium elongatum DSM 19469]